MSPFICEKVGLMSLTVTDTVVKKTLRPHVKLKIFNFTKKRYIKLYVQHKNIEIPSYYFVKKLM